MKTSESIQLLIDGLRKADAMLNESERMHPPYFAPLVSLTMLAEECAELAREVEEIKSKLPTALGL